MKPDLALAAIEAVAIDHRYGHTCHDGKWWNERVGTRTPCPVTGHLETARSQVVRLAASVHEAAHHTPTCERVAEGMTGLVMADLAAEDAEGWTRTARMAIEALAHQLDRDPVREARATAAAARIGGAASA